MDRRGELPPCVDLADDLDNLDNLRRFVANDSSNESAGLRSFEEARGSIVSRARERKKERKKVSRKGKRGVSHQENDCNSKTRSKGT